MTLRFILERFQQLAESASIQRASKASDKLASHFRWDTFPPTWLNGYGVRIDTRRRGYIEVGVMPGYPIPNLPTHFDGVPVIVKHREMAKIQPQ